MEIAKQKLVPERQRALHQRYRETPEAAWICDHARAVVGDATDPFHGRIEPANNGGERWAYGIHRAVGGDHDAPNPGDVLASALAACLHSTTRMIAQWLEISLTDLEVEVSAEVDVRGALRVDTSVPVGFQCIRCDVSGQANPGSNGVDQLKTLTVSAEACCVVLQTLRQGIDVRSNWRLGQG